MDLPGQDTVCEHCGAHQSTDLDICIICGNDRGPSPAVVPVTAQAPVPPPAAHQMMVPRAPVPRTRMYMGLIVGVIGLLLAVVAIASISWFVIEDTEEASGIYLGLREVEYRIANGDVVINDYRRSYADFERDMGGELEVSGVAGVTFWLLVIGLTLAGMFILFVLLALIGMFRGATEWLPVVTGVVAGLLIVVAASYFGATYQDALEGDMDVNLDESEDSDHGLGGVWYMALFGGIMVLLGAILTIGRSPISPRPEQMR